MNNDGHRLYCFPIFHPTQHALYNMGVLTCAYINVLLNNFLYIYILFTYLLYQTIFVLASDQNLLHITR